MINGGNGYTTGTRPSTDGEFDEGYFEKAVGFYYDCRAVAVCWESLPTGLSQHDAGSPHANTLLDGGQVPESVKKAIETTLEQTFQATSLSAARSPPSVLAAFIRECLSAERSPYKSFETQHCAPDLYSVPCGCLSL